jgi:D-alanyl-D-alanine carboxypeptidase/D-alanyl-D-alanine-endopeptidase (penicillin-binding protein 4)
VQVNKLVRALLAALTLAACSHSGASSPVHRPGATMAPTTAAVPAKSAKAAKPTTTIPTTTTAPPTLVNRLDAVVAGTNSCLLVTDGGNGAVRYSHQADVPLTPASTQKLLVAAAALDRLGPTYRFTTTVVARRRPVGGEVDDLWLVGGGDPLLTSADYAAFLQTLPATAGYPTTSAESLAGAVAAAGVRTVHNGVHGDDSRYEPLRYLPTYPAKLNQGEFDIGPLGGLEMNQGLERFHPDIPTPDPTIKAAQVFASLLASRGVTVAGAADAVAPPGAVVLAQVQSAPLSQILTAMLHASDNQIAELVVREIDRQGGGKGSTARGVQLVMSDVNSIGLPTAGLTMVDGSGLSAADHVTCRTLLAALGLGDQARFSTLSTGLPVAAVSGGMYYLFRGTPAAGRLAAKGGYITGVSALVGRLDEGHPLRFAYIVNGPFSFTAGLALEENLVAALGNG